MSEYSGDAAQKSAAQRAKVEPEISSEAEAILNQLASVFLNNGPRASATGGQSGDELQGRMDADEVEPKHEDMYRVLVEQIPALVFIAYFDRGIGEAYVSPQIEAALGFTQEEWLEDPIRWYQQIHPEDKDRWSVEAAETFLSG